MNSLHLTTVNGRVTFNGGTYNQLDADNKLLFDQAIHERKGLPTSEQPPFNTIKLVPGVIDLNDPNFDLPLIDVPMGNFDADVLPQTVPQQYYLITTATMRSADLK